MCFCQINTTEVVQNRPINMGRLWTKGNFVVRKILFEFLLPEQQQSVTCTNQTDVSVYPWTRSEKITFDQSFVSKHHTFSFENCCLNEKRMSKDVETFQKFGGWGTETFSDQSKTQTSCDMAVANTIHCSMSPRCSKSPHLTTVKIYHSSFM